MTVRTKYRIAESTILAAALIVGSYVIGYVLSGIVHAALAPLAAALR